MSTVTRTSSYSQVEPSVFFVYLALYFVYLFVLLLSMCPHPFVFSWAVESSPLQVLALA